VTHNNPSRYHDLPSTAEKTAVDAAYNTSDRIRINATVAISAKQNPKLVHSDLLDVNQMFVNPSKRIHLSY